MGVFRCFMFYLTLCMLMSSSIGMLCAQQKLPVRHMEIAVLPQASFRDTQKIGELIRQSEELRHDETKKAISLLEEAVMLSRTSGCNECMAKAKMNLGNCYSILGAFLTAKQHLLEALPYALHVPGKRERLLSLWYNYMLTPYTQTGHNDSAMNFAITGLGLAESANDTTLIIRSHINIGAILINNQKYATAIQYLQRAERYTFQSGDYSLLSSLYYNYASAYSNLKDTRNQYVYSRKAYDASLRSNDNKIRALAIGNMGFYYLNLGQPEKSVSYFKEAIRSANNSFRRFLPTRALSQAYLDMGDVTKAAHYARQALGLANQTNLRDRSLLFLYQLLADIYQQTGEYRQAYIFQHKYAGLNDSIMQVERTRAIDQMEIRYQVLEKNRELTRKEWELERERYNNRNKNTWIVVISCGALLVSLALISFLRSSRRKIHIMKQKDEINTLKAMIKGQEQERDRVGRELHDGIAGLVTAAGINLNNLGDAFSEITSHPGYRRTEMLLEQINSDVRKTAHNLMPDILLQNGLPEAVRIFCSYVNRQQDLHFDVKSEGAHEWIDHDKILPVFRIIQELIQNIIKHAKATYALIHFCTGADRMSITIQDNGTGYEPGHYGSGMGLKNIYARVSALDGTISISTGKDEGTSVFIEFGKEMLA